MPFKGVLYAGLMIGKSGPRLVEYNCRFGDPETQVLMMRLKSDIVPALIACADGGLEAFRPALVGRDGADGDPRHQGLSGLPIPRAARSAASTPLPRSPGVQIFHAGTKARRQPHPRQRRARAERDGDGAHRAGSPRARVSRRGPDRLAGRLLPARYRMAGSRFRSRDSDRRPGLDSRHARFTRSFAAPAGATALSLRRGAGARHDQERRARHLLAAHAAAVPAQPHQPVADRGEADGWTIVDTGINTDATRELWEKIFAEQLGGKPVTPRDRHAPASRPYRPRRLAVRALERAALHDARRVHERDRRAQRLHRERGPARGAHLARNGVPADKISLFHRHKGGYAKGVAPLPTGLPAPDPRPSDHHRRPSLGRRRRPRPCARARLAMVPRAQRADRRRPGAAQDQHQCRRVAQRAAGRRADLVPRRLLALPPPAGRRAGAAEPRLPVRRPAHPPRPARSPTTTRG